MPKLHASWCRFVPPPIDRSECEYWSDKRINIPDICFFLLALWTAALLRYVRCNVSCAPDFYFGEVSSDKRTKQDQSYRLEHRRVQRWGTNHANCVSVWKIWTFRRQNVRIFHLKSTDRKSTRFIVQEWFVRYILACKCQLVHQINETNFAAFWRDLNIL